MIKISHGPKILVLAAAFAGASSLAAAPLCTSFTQKLSSYIGNPCQIGNDLFDITSYSFNGTATPSTAVSVSIVGDGSIGTPTGFTFSAPTWTMSGFTPKNLSLAMTVSFVLPGSGFTSASSSITTTMPTAPGNFVNSNDTLTGGASGNINYTLVSTGSTNGSISLNGPSYSFDDSTVVGGFGGGTVQVNSFTETLTSATVPEPVTTALVGSALLGLGVMLRRRRAQK